MHDREDRPDYWREIALVVQREKERREGIDVAHTRITSGKLSLEGLVTHRYGLDDVNEAFATAVDKPQGFVKSTVTFWSQ